MWGWSASVAQNIVESDVKYHSPFYIVKKGQYKYEQKAV
jgi:hypothetical protein